MLSYTHALAASGMGVGFLSGLLGMGGGFITVPALYHAIDPSMRTIVATSLAVIALVPAGGVVAPAIGRYVDWHVTLSPAAGALTSMLVGQRSAQHLAGPALQQGLAAFAGVVALGMIV